jgi:hypothetical protein
MDAMEFLKTANLSKSKACLCVPYGICEVVEVSMYNDMEMKPTHKFLSVPQISSFRYYI